MPTSEPGRQTTATGYHVRYSPLRPVLTDLDRRLCGRSPFNPRWQSVKHPSEPGRQTTATGYHVRYSPLRPVLTDLDRRLCGRSPFNPRWQSVKHPTETR